MKINFYAYYPEKFQSIMRMDNMMLDDLPDIFNIDKNREKIFKAGQASGASGSFFFFTKDNQFIIKTLRGNEMKTMIKMLDDYIDHIKKSNNMSLLARIYGIYTLDMLGLRKINIIIM